MLSSPSATAATDAGSTTDPDAAAETSASLEPAVDDHGEILPPIDLGCGGLREIVPAERVRHAGRLRRKKRRKLPPAIASTFPSE
jgi:hypothetical protein